MIHVKVSILITKGIKPMYSFETVKGRRNEKMGGFFNTKNEKKEKSRTNRDTEQDGRNKSKCIKNKLITLGFKYLKMRFFSFNFQLYTF